MSRQGHAKIVEASPRAGRWLVNMVAVLALGLAVAGEGTGAERGRRVISGPVIADVLKVIDGDTIKVRAQIWVDQYIEINVRFAGTDTPELRARCPDERLRAVLARAELERLVLDGEVILYDIEADKYGGRVAARVQSIDGVDLGLAMQARGLGVPYDGGARVDWCAQATAAR